MAEVMRWFLATAITASELHINAFDEPNVQESKDRTVSLLNQYAVEGKLSGGVPLVIDGEVLGYGDREAYNKMTAPAPGRSLDWQRAATEPGYKMVQAVEALFRQIKPGDYVMIASFLPRLPQLDDTVTSLREHLAKRLRIATMLGFGPRYLHSTGQLHKGGPDRAVLLFLTADDPVDLPIPSRPYTFGVLKQAQALGDFMALMERHRRVLRLHLGRSPEAALQRLLTAFS